jgi:hypothetical protein
MKYTETTDTSFKLNAQLLALHMQHSFFYIFPFILTGSLRRRQSQQSFNTLTPFNFLFYSPHVSAPTGHPQVRYTISYLKDYFNTTDPLHVPNLIWGCYLLSSVFQFVVLIHVIVLNIKNCKISKIPRY